MFTHFTLFYSRNVSFEAKLLICTSNTVYVFIWHSCKLDKSNYAALYFRLMDLLDMPAPWLLHKKTKNFLWCTESRHQPVVLRREPHSRASRWHMVLAALEDHPAGHLLMVQALHPPDRGAAVAALHRHHTPQEAHTLQAVQSPMEGTAIRMRRRVTTLETVQVDKRML